MEGRDLVRTTTLEEFRRDPSLLKRGSQDEGELSLFPEYPYPGHAWGMVIDLNACVGCNACVTACQAENNIPVVGKREVLREREMHWIRVDRYYQTENDELRVLHQPVPCMHCEHAPCELVCPVAATVHSSDGLNDMVYNRCVGTRYCSNNCPYKVRRFNFFEFADFQTESLKMLHNPDVTVRSRGVMEKCTYCVQRIRGAEIQARKEGRPIRDGEILTACQAACPADAIIFGDINDPNSQIAQLKAQPHNYGLLDELNTRPRTTYLGMVRNPNPALRSAQP
jgi:molybdopterin-containing oxidoreductase family iron-sulfur binding subunit